MEKVLKQYGVHHRFAIAYIADQSGKVKNTNRALKRILKKRLRIIFSFGKGNLMTLWAFRTEYKTPIVTREKRFLQLHELNELRLQVYENSKLYKDRIKFKALKLVSKWYGPFLVKHGFPSGYVELYDKHEGSFIVNGHRVKLYHDEEQLNELTSEEIHLMCEKGQMKAIPFMAPFLKDYRKTMTWVVEKPFIYIIVENTCNEDKLYDLDETSKGIVKGNILYIKKDLCEKFPLGEK
ncbi:reverse transcriptase domain-containing protein [Tanacetum coccineum]